MTSAGEHSKKPETMLAMAGQEAFRSVRDSLNPAPSLSKPNAESGPTKANGGYQVNLLTGSSFSAARDPRLANKKMARSGACDPAPYAFQKLHLQPNSASGSPVSVVSSSGSDNSNDQVPESLLQGDTVLNFLMEQLEEMKRSAPKTESACNEATKRSGQQADLTTEETAESKRPRSDHQQVATTSSCDSLVQKGKSSSAETETSTDEDNKFNVQINIKRPAFVASTVRAVKTAKVSHHTPSAWSNRNKQPAAKRPLKQLDPNYAINNTAKNGYAGQRRPVEYAANFEMKNTAFGHGSGSGGYSGPLASGAHNTAPMYPQEANYANYWPNYGYDYLQDPGERFS